MTTDAPQLTLVGRTSSWRLHLPATAMAKANHVMSGGVFDTPLLVTWLRHASYGLIGIYTTNDIGLGGLERRRGAWVQVTGSIRPRRATALRDDPRSALAPTDTPLLLAIRSIEPVAAPPAMLDKPVVASPQSIRTSSGQSAGSGWIAAVAGWPDAVVWHTAQTAAVFTQWNTVHGVVTRLGQQRYLRYVLRCVSRIEQSKERYD